VSAPGSPAPDPTRHLDVLLSTLPEPPVPPHRAEAAVLILARTTDAGVEVLAEQRAEQATDPWSGQVGLPGGHRDPRDPSLTQTVLRELQEELGFPPEVIVGTPRLFEIRRARPAGLRVAVFAGRCVPAALPVPRVERIEVSGTFWLPLGALESVENRPRTTVFGEASVPTVLFEGHVVWGFTLRVLTDFRQWLHGVNGTPEARRDESSWKSQAL